MISEEFSFPKIANPIPRFIFSPSLWRISSVIYPDYVDEELGDEREEEFRRKSFPSERESEEKMDMLWEDFNEDLKRSVGTTGLPSRGNGLESCTEMDIYVLHRSKAAGSATGLVCHRRAGNYSMFVKKVLRKIFFLHYSVRFKK